MQLIPTGGAAVPIDERLMEILVCPACQGAIAATDDDCGILCRECGRIYPIRDGIPVMLVEEATKAT